MSNFAEYATSSALRVSLSRPQIETLCALHQGLVDTEQRSFMATRGALQRKGFIEIVPFCSIEKFAGAESIWFTAHITEAGKLMVELIKLAGLYVDYIFESDSHTGINKYGVKR